MIMTDSSKTPSPGALVQPTASTLAGAFVPAYLINAALGRIPIIGKLFTGGEEGGGVFAARYELTGRLEDPKVSMNPLSVVAPGFLRNVFGVPDADSAPSDPVVDTNSSEPGR